MNTGSTNHKIRVLLIEDNEADYLLTRAILAMAGQKATVCRNDFELMWADGLSSGLVELKEKTFDVILLDLSLPETDGLNTFHQVQSTAPNVPIVVLTGLDDESLAVQALHEGAQDYLVKGRTSDFLPRSIRYAIERHKISFELKEAKDAALAATTAKSQFLANMSHEIRTPLTAIVGFAEIVIEPETVQNERVLAANAIVRNSKHLQSIIDNILDMSKIEAGKLELEFLPYSLHQIISDIEGPMRLRADEKNIGFLVEYSYPIPETIVTDSTRVRQVLINLVSNAIKFTEQGEVKIVVSCDVTQEQLSFRVIDTGIGISQENLSKLFQVFSQGDASITRRFGGTGLGLAISQRLSGKLGNPIVVESQPGKGSTFTFVIQTGALDPQKMLDGPLHPETLPPVPKKVFRIPQLSGKVLLVEDGPDNQQLISYHLHRSGVQVEVVENGALAVDRGLREDFDLVLMDLQMPVMDGYSATKELRSKGFTKPIVAITASVRNESIKKCFSIGCDDCISKPFAIDTFFFTISKYLPHLALEEPIRHTEEDADPEYAMLVSDFVDKLPQRLSEMRAAFHAEDWSTLEMLAHRLRSASNFGYPLLTSSSTALEQAAKSGEAVACRKLIGKFAGLIQRIYAGREKVPLRPVHHEKNPSYSI